MSSKGQRSEVAVPALPTATVASAAPVVLAADLGKTSCRVGLWYDGSRVAEAVGSGAPGLAEAGGVRAAADAVGSLARKLPDQPGAFPHVLAIGAAGATAAPCAATVLARLLADELRVARVAVTSDAVTAHAGALGGAAGVVLAAGTGSVAIGLSGTGEWHLADGWGQWLGDDGGGAWVGRTALSAVLRARDGRGRATALTAHAEERYGDLSLLPATIAADGNPARCTAMFAPDVARCAGAGDAVARTVLEDAARALAETTLAAVRATHGDDPVPVAFVGGLSQSVAPYWGAMLFDPCRAALAATSARYGIAVDLRAPLGTALDGAALLAACTDLPHEAHVVRVHHAAPGGFVTPSHDSTANRLDDLATEQVRPGLEDLDTRSSDDVVGLLLAAEAEVPAALAAARPALTVAVEATVDRLAGGGRLLYVGAGTPGRLAAQDAAECAPTFGVPRGLVVAVIAGGETALQRASEGAEDDDAAGAADLRARVVGATDVVVGISASGRTPYVLGAVKAAHEAGAATVAVVNNPASPLAAAADHAIEVLTGPEVIGGSTRLTAATAQKIVLNTLSTTVMVRLGRTYGARMVEVQATNDKLRRRAIRIVREVTGVDEDTAFTALTAAGWRVEVALVALLAGVEADVARHRLDAADNRVREALARPDVEPMVTP